MNQFMKKFFTFSAVVLAFFILNSFSLPSGARGNEPEVKKSASISASQSASASTSTAGDAAKKVDAAPADGHDEKEGECKMCHEKNGKKHPECKKCHNGKEKCDHCKECEGTGSKDCEHCKRHSKKKGAGGVAEEEHEHEAAGNAGDNSMKGPKKDEAKK